jgi:hypothetical protein
MSEPSHPGGATGPSGDAPMAAASPSEGDVPDDLKRERDAFIQQFFRKGAQFTDELLRENQRLRRDMNEVEAENSSLRAALASNEAIRDLLKKIGLLEEEKAQLLSKSARMRQLTDEFNSRYTEVETELSNLASLHVATSQLHAARTVRRALRNLKELLGQILGAGSFAVYLTTADRSQLVAVAHDGHLPDALRRLSVEDSHIGGIFMRGEIEFDPEADPSRGSAERPSVVVPLHLEIPAEPGSDAASVREPLGAIVIFSTLEQKAQIWPADVQLFKLLASHAAPAVVHALLFERSRSSLLARGTASAAGVETPPGETLAGELLAAAGTDI